MAFTLETVIWLLGVWQSVTPQGITTEEWKREGNYLLGSGTFIKDDKKLFGEDLYIKQLSGYVVYIAVPEGQSPVLFNLETADDNSLTFTNREHDFPQVIKYTRNETELFIELEGINNGSIFKKSYTLHKISNH